MAVGETTAVVVDETTTAIASPPETKTAIAHAITTTIATAVGAAMMLENLLALRAAIAIATQNVEIMTMRAIAAPTKTVDLPTTPALPIAIEKSAVLPLAPLATLAPISIKTTGMRMTTGYSRIDSRGVI
jgi:hypothetical protein